MPTVLPDATTVHLVDASPYVFRAYFSVPTTMTSPDGRPVNAVHGFISFLLKLAEGEKPTHVAVAFDESLTTSFRNDLHPGYKAQRALPPPELEAQLGWCREAAEALGATTCASDRYEADDLIASIAGALPDCRVVIVSPDKDLAQLVSDRVTLLDFARNLRHGPDEVRARFGVSPGQVADLLGLGGDAVDNIPGVKGVGPRTAAALLQRFGSLDALYERLDEVASMQLRGARGVRDRLERGREMAFLSRRLATVATDAPCETSLDELRWRGPDAAKVGPLFERLGFGRLRERALAR